MNDRRASLFDLPQCVLEEYILGRLPCNDVVRFWATHPLFQKPGFWERQCALRHKESAAHAAAMGVVSSVWPLESGNREEFGKQARFAMGKRCRMIPGLWMAFNDQYALAFSPDGCTLATLADDVMLWDATTGALKATIVHGFPNGEYLCSSLAFSPDASTLVVTKSKDFTVEIWDAAAYMARNTPEALAVFALSPDGRTIVARYREDIHGHALLLDAATGVLKATLVGQQLFSGEMVVFSPDGCTLAFGSSRSSYALWDVATGVRKATLTDTHVDLGRLVFSPDSKTIIALFRNNVMLWDTGTGTLKATLNGHTGLQRFTKLAFSPDGCMIATNTGMLWDAETGAPKTLSRDEVYFTAFSPDGRILATLVNMSEDKEAEESTAVQLWDAHTGALRAETSAGPASHWIFSVAFSPDGRTIAGICNNEHVWMWVIQYAQ